MMTNYDLKILAALIDKEVDKELDYYTLSFPDSWLKRLNRLYSKISRNTNSYFPIKSLSNVLMSLFPEIIKTENNFYKMKRVWLISTKRISIKTLFHIIKIWIKIVFKKAKSNEINLNILEEQIKLQDLTWKKERINLIESRLSENGTFQPKGEYFNIIPEHFLQRLIDENFQVKLNHEKFNFKKVGDELISWPPKKYYYNNEASFYSLKLKFKTVTYPFLDQPVIQFLPSFSPWISNSLKYGDNYNLKYQKSSSVYIHMIDPFLVNNNANSLLKASISKYNEKLRWDNYILEIMSSLSVEEKLPKIEKLANNPITFLENKGGIQAAIAASNNIYNVSRQVLPPGLSLTDQKDIFLQALVYLPELINFNQEYKSQRFSGGIRRDVAILKNRSDQAKSERREKLAKKVGNKVRFEIIYENSQMKRHLQKAISEIFDLNNVLDNDGIFSTPEIEIEIKTIEEGKTLSRLSTNNKKKHEYKNAYHEKIELIKARYKTTEIPTLTLVELKKDWDDNKDPKFALREGLALSNRFTQFITPKDFKNEENKKQNLKVCENAIWDLLRQVGFVSSPPKFKLANKYNLPEEINIFGFYILRKNASYYKKSICYPLAVYMNTKNLNIKVKYPDSNNTWKSYSEAILDIAKNVNYNDKRKYNHQFNKRKSSITNFFARLFHYDIKNKSNSLLLVDSQNVRYYWSWIANKNISKDQIYFNKNEKIELSNFPDLRIVRTNTGEPPKWYGLNKKGEVNQTSGLFNYQKDMFLSLPLKRAVYKYINHKKSKMEEMESFFRAPKPLDIFTVSLLKNDQPESWAKITHELRRMSSHFDDFTKLPVPLHLASKIEEYIYKL